MKIQKFGFDTQQIHGGSHARNAENALNTPIYQTATFVFEDMDHVDRVMSFESSDCVYTRGNNPTLKVFENRMAVLEEGTSSIAFSSGMAAISSVLLSLLKPRDKVLVHRTLYGSTYNVVTKILPRYDIEFEMLNLTNIVELEEAIKDSSVKVIYFETPSNPNLEVIDIEAVCSLAYQYDVKVVIDNTFASPYLQRPLTMGAYVVIHSATKYICGHGDVVGGVAISRDDDYMMELRFDYMSELGGVMSPFDAWLLIRGLKTLSLRMDRHVENAMALAEFLEQHPKVTKVYYPGLASFPQYELAKKQMSGFGAIISFEVEGGLEYAKKVINAVRLAQIAVSLGDCETLIQFPAAMTHRGYNQEDLEMFGLSASMLRISVGLESIEDLIADFSQALDVI